MTSREQSRIGRHRTRWILLAGPILVLGALVGVGGDRPEAFSAPASAPPVEVALSDRHVVLVAPDGALPGNRRSGLGAADGLLPDGTTVFEDDLPGVANLDPALLHALRRAATDAANDDVELFVDSGWRSAKYQGVLLQHAVTTYGSAAEAARWVATPATSPHVSGDAVDIRNADATAWLSEHGAAYGLCQIYRNEPWHYELRPGAVDHGCPRPYADPTHDPRMRG